LKLTKKRKESLGIRNTDEPRILLWDIETSHMICAVFDLDPGYISHENILQDWFMICAAWKWHGSDRVYVKSISDNKKKFKQDHTDDSELIQSLHAVLMNTDIIVAHNGDRFDTKKFNTRAIKYGLEPVPFIPSVDTLREAKRYFKFTSNRLDYLGEFLGVGRKIETTRGLWLRVLNGDIEAAKEMAKYNIGDVELLERVYLKLRPHMRTHPNLNLLQGTDHACPNCGSGDIQRRGTRRTRVSVFQRYSCNSCGSWSSTGKALDRTDVR